MLFSSRHEERPIYVGISNLNCAERERRKATTPQLRTMEQLLTVIIQTSPLPSHPSTALLEALFRSFDRVDGLKEANIIILADGCDEFEEEKKTNDIHDVDGCDGQIATKKANFKHGAAPLDTRENYKQHLHLLRDKVNSKQAPFVPSKNGSIQLLELQRRHGSARAIAAAFNILSISTPYVLIGQHDNFFVRDVSYLRQLLQYMEKPETNSWLQCVHFPSTATLNYVQKVKRRYDLDISRLCVDCDNIQGSRFVPLVFWYGRTSLSRTSYYEQILNRFRNLKVSDHLEELLGTQQLDELNKIKGRNDVDFDDEFRRVHAQYGNYVIFDSSNSQTQTEVLYHMSGRKVRAADTASSSSETDLQQSDQADNNDAVMFNPQANSFTAARRSIAKVHGLEFITSEKGDRNMQKKFKQNCFHCGEKGHSFKFCPSLKKENSMPSIDVLQI